MRLGTAAAPASRSGRVTARAPQPSQAEDLDSLLWVQAPESRRGASVARSSSCFNLPRARFCRVLPFRFRRTGSGSFHGERESANDAKSAVRYRWRFGRPANLTVLPVEPYHAETRTE